jgi:hypothetical protein
MVGPASCIKAYLAAAGLGATSEVGQTEKNSVRANIFRFALVVSTGRRNTLS